MPSNLFPPFNESERELERFDPAWAKAAMYFRTNCVWHLGHGDDELRLQGIQTIHEQLEARRAAYEAGSARDLLHAVALCARENLPLPSWLALAYLEKFEAFIHEGGPTSLDEAFVQAEEPAVLTPSKRRKHRRDTAIAGRIWLAVQAVKARHRGLDTALREVLAADRSIPVGLSRARELVDRFDREQCRLMQGAQPLSRYWANLRKR